MAQYRLSEYDGRGFELENFIRHRYFKAVDDNEALDIAECMYEESLKVWNNLIKIDTNGDEIVVISSL